MKIIYVIAGLLAVTLGSIGAFLPGLPTTPFLLYFSFHKVIINSNKSCSLVVGAGFVAISIPEKTK